MYVYIRYKERKIKYGESDITIYYTHTCILTQMEAYVHIRIDLRTYTYVHIYLYIYTKLSMCVQRVKGAERPVLAALNVDVVR